MHDLRLVINLSIFKEKISSSLEGLQALSSFVESEVSSSHFLHYAPKTAVTMKRDKF